MRIRFACLAALVGCWSEPAPEPTGSVVARLFASQLLVDDDVAYVVGGNGSNGSGIVRVPLDGGASQMMIVLNASAVEAMDDASVYFATNGLVDGGAVARLGKIDGGLEVLIATQAWGIAVDEAYVYFHDAHAILRVPKTGGAAETIATTLGYIDAFVVDDTTVYWTESPILDGSIALLANVESMPKDGGTPETLATGASPISPLAVDSAAVYWASIGNLDVGSIIRFDKSTSSTTVLATGNDCLGPESMTTGSGRVFWSGIEHIAYPDGDGGAAHLVRSSTNVPDIEVHGASLYWLDHDYDAGVTNLRATPTP